MMSFDLTPRMLSRFVMLGCLLAALATAPALAQEALKPVLPIATSLNQPLEKIRSAAAEDSGAKNILESIKKISEKTAKLGAAAEVAAELSKIWKNAKSLSPAVQEGATEWVIVYWRARLKGDKSWSKFPFPLAPYKDVTAVQAVSERQALEAWDKQQKPLAIQKYNMLASRAAGSPKAGVLDARIFRLEKMLFQQDKKPLRFHKSLQNLITLYKDSGHLGAGQEASVTKILNQFQREYDLFVEKQLLIARNPSISPADRQVTIAIALRYLEGAEEKAPRTMAIKRSLGEVYAAAQQHKKAVAVFASLAESQGQSAAAVRDWDLAIRSQLILADWDEKDAWKVAESKPQRLQEREVLRSFYSKRLDIASNDWKNLTQWGLVNFHLGYSDEVCKAWRDRLKANSSNAVVPLMMGLMLHHFESKALWQDLESSARLARERGIQPVYRDKNLVVNDLLALSLREGGREALTQGKYQVAVQKLEEFVAKFPRAPKHDEGYVLLSDAYAKAGNHLRSMETLIAFSKAHPESRLLRDSLFNGFEKSTQLAYEDSSIYFGEMFLQRFPRDKDWLNVADPLIQLYQGRELYAELKNLLNRKLNSSFISAGQKADVAQEILATEFKEGSLEGAARLADEYLRRFQGNPSVLAEAWRTKAHLAYAKKDLVGLGKVEAQMARLGEGSGVSDALGEVRFLVAEGLSEPLFRKEIFSLELKHPLQTIEEQMSRLKTSMAAYRRVCEAGDSSYCGAASFQAARTAERLISILEVVQISQGLAKNEVTAFEQRRDQMIDELVRVAGAADKRATAELKEGKVHPTWTAAILWQSGSDWNEQRIGGTTGMGYLQWLAGNK